MHLYLCVVCVLFETEFFSLFWLYAIKIPVNIIKIIIRWLSQLSIYSSRVQWMHSQFISRNKYDDRYYYEKLQNSKKRRICFVIYRSNWTLIFASAWCDFRNWNKSHAYYGWCRLAIFRFILFISIRIHPCFSFTLLFIRFSFSSTCFFFDIVIEHLRQYCIKMCMWSFNKRASNSFN